VTNDFLDNLGANQYRKMHQPKKIKLTPQTYIDMNEEFEQNGDRVRIEVPTQEAIDKWQNWIDPDMHNRTVEPKDMVQEMWDAIGGRPND
tara:strand:- start:1129 stop:1398 length:270 start_codon:yes stop_codon:yes gene_type:complete